MSTPARKRLNFDVTPEQEAEISWLREVLGASTARDTLIRAVRIAAVLWREAREGRELMVRAPGKEPQGLVIPELERPAAGGRFLVEREHPWQRQMWIKGRRLRASIVWRDMAANGQTAEQAAREWDLPIEAVDEAVRWSEANRDLLAMESQEEARRLRSEGVAPASAR